MTIYHTKVDLVNSHVYTKFDQVLSFHSQDIEKKNNELFRNDRITELHNDRQGKSSIAPTFSKRGYNKIKAEFL